VDDSVCQTLMKLRDEFGLSLLKDPDRLEAHLRDLAPGKHAEIHCLVSAVREGVVADLLSASGALPIDAVVPRLAEGLRGRVGMDREAAHWAVQSLALAIGKLQTRAAPHEPPEADAASALTAPLQVAGPPAAAAQAAAARPTEPPLPGAGDQAAWIPVYFSTSRGTRLRAVAFSDAIHGWAVGSGGAILATTDGGATWKAQSSGTSASLYGVAFSDATHGWAVGSGGAILATTNGGATWKAQSSRTGAFLTGVAFSDATHGWAVGSGGAVLATTDGGDTWIAQKSGTGAHLYAVAFSDATRGRVVGFDGIILATTNGGATWSKQGSWSSEWLRGVASKDATHGFAVGEGGAILAARDGDD